MSMATSPFAPEFDCVDDLMREVIIRLINDGLPFSASKGSGVELLGISLRLINPRARISRSETRGKVFSGLGELLWYLSGSNKLAFITYYISAYNEASNDDSVRGGYGPRLFGSDGKGQICDVIRLLRDKASSRRAAIQLFFAGDIEQNYPDVPCTCTLQAILRNDALNLIVYMRSNDAYLGLPHDIFAFTMLQEMIARALGVDVGFYQHMVGSIHLYEKNRENAELFLAEKYQTIDPMPPMPKGDPLLLRHALLKAESSIREDPHASLNERFEPYWEDLLRLLRVYSEKHHKLPGYETRISQIKSGMDSRAYDVYFP